MRTEDGGSLTGGCDGSLAVKNYRNSMNPSGHEGLKTLVEMLERIYKETDYPPKTTIIFAFSE